MAKRILLFLLIISLISISGCAKKMLNPQLAWDQQEYEALVSQGKEYLLTNPDDDAARLLIGRAGFKTGDSLFAITTLKPVTAGIQEIRLLDDIISAAISNGDLYFARDLISQKISLFGESYNAKDKLAAVQSMIHQATYSASNGFKAFEKEEWVKAVKFYREALGIFSQQKEIKSFFLLAQSEVLIQNALSSKGEAIVAKITESRSLNPDSPYSWYVEGDYYFQSGNKEMAVKSFQVALEKGLKGNFAVKAKSFTK